MYFVSPELYVEAASHLCDAIDGRSYFSGSVIFSFEQMACRLTASLIVYRERKSYPEGEVDAIVRLVPVWWEFHTVGTDGEVLNDFCLSELERCIV